MLSFLPKTPNELQQDLKAKFKQKRKSLKITQQELANKSAVSLVALNALNKLGKYHWSFC